MTTILDDIFSKMDNSKFEILGFKFTAAFSNVRFWRRYILVLVVFSAACWAFFGFDSSIWMFNPFVDNFFALITGKISFAEVWSQTYAYYGIGIHFSAPVVYGLAFIILSLHLEKFNIIKSLNFFMTTALSFFNIGVFELTYNVIYAYAQNQLWTIALQYKQGQNITMFTLFIVVGIIAFLYLYASGYKPNLNKWTIILSVSAIGFWLLWIFYPFPIQHFVVETTVGTWTNSNIFPQTMYAVDIDPLDNVAIGVPYHIENNSLHAVNILTKVFTTLAILSACMVKKEELIHEETINSPL